MKWITKDHKRIPISEGSVDYRTAQEPIYMAGGSEYRDANGKLVTWSSRDSTTAQMVLHIKSAKQVLKPLNKETYDKLYFYEITDPKMREMHQGYNYIITNGATSHTAFHTKEALNKWLKDTGVVLTGNVNVLNKEGMSNPHDKVYQLHGKYQVISMSGNAELLKKFAESKGMIPTKVYSNGRITRAYIEKASGSKQGNTIYELNPNYPREEFPYQREIV